MLPGLPCGTAMMMSGLRLTTISSEILAVPLGDVSPLREQRAAGLGDDVAAPEFASIAYGVRPTPRITSTRGRLRDAALGRGDVGSIFGSRARRRRGCGRGRAPIARVSRPTAATLVGSLS